MVFPRNDYALAKYLIDTNRLQSQVSLRNHPNLLTLELQELRRVMDVGALLESCDFGLFWRLMRGDYKPSDAPEERFKNPADVQKTIKPVAGFEDAVRNCKRNARSQVISLAELQSFRAKRLDRVLLSTCLFRPMLT